MQPAALALTTSFAAPTHAQRERWQNVDAIFSALQVEEGDTIADYLDEMDTEPEAEGYEAAVDMP